MMVYIFDFIYVIAVNDATNRVSETGDKEKLLKNIEIKKRIRNYADSIIEGKEKYDFYAFVDEIKHINEGSESKVKKLTFGKIQKLINMTMKYLYIQYYNDNEIAARFNICHAPMDSIMRDFVYWSYKKIIGGEPGFSKYCSWSTIDGDNVEENSKREYVAFQDAIQVILNEKGIRNKIEFDYIFWNDAKEISGKNNEKQKSMVDNIWNEYENHLHPVTVTEQ